MPWVIEKKSADVQGNNVSATSASAKTIGIPIRGLLKSNLEAEPSRSGRNAILSPLLKPIQNLASKITEFLKEPFDTRAQYRLIEDSETDTAVDAVVPDTASKRSSRVSAYKQWRAEALQNGERELDVEDLGPLPPSAGLDTRLRLTMQGLV